MNLGLDYKSITDIVSFTSQPKLFTIYETLLKVYVSVIDCVNAICLDGHKDLQVVFPGGVPIQLCSMTYFMQTLFSYIIEKFSNLSIKKLL